MTNYLGIIVPILTTAVIIFILLMLLFDPFKILYKHMTPKQKPLNGNGILINACIKWANELDYVFPEHIEINNIPKLLNSLKILRFEEGLARPISDLAYDTINIIEFWLHIDELNPRLKGTSEKAEEEFYKELKQHINQLYYYIKKAESQLSLDKLTPMLVNLRGMITKWNTHFRRCFECAQRNPSVVRELNEELEQLKVSSKYN